MPSGLVAFDVFSWQFARSHVIIVHNYYEYVQQEILGEQPIPAGKKNRQYFMRVRGSFNTITQQGRHRLILFYWMLPRFPFYFKVCSLCDLTLSNSSQLILYAYALQSHSIRGGLFWLLKWHYQMDIYKVWILLSVRVWYILIHRATTIPLLFLHDKSDLIDRWIVTNN